MHLYEDGMVVVDEDSLSVDDTDSPLLSRSANVIAKRNVEICLSLLCFTFFSLQEQLRRWADSETNKEMDNLSREQKVKFRVRRNE